VSIEAFIRDYVFKELGASAVLGLEDELNIDTFGTIAPLTIAPMVSPFKRREERDFPIYKDSVSRAKDPTQQGVVPDYQEPDEGSDDYDDVNIEDLPTNLTSIIGDVGKSGKLGDYQVGPKGTRSTFGITQTFDPGDILGGLADLSGTFVPASFAGQKNLEQLQYTQAMAALGKPGYGIGIVNNQVVGVTPNNIIGTLPTNISPKDRDRIREAFTGKSGPMKAGVQAMATKFSPTATFTTAEQRFQNEIINSKLAPEIKAELLGFDPKGRGQYAFSPGRLQAQFTTTTPPSYRAGVSYKDFVKDYTFAARNRAGDVTGFTDVSAPSMGLETDIDAQVSQKNPMGINIGIDMANITGVPTGVGATGDLGGGGGGPTGGVSGLDASSGVSTGGYSDDESGDNQGSGFGGGGWTAYGGRIGKFNGGFVSNTETIRGVGLIKPEETFMDTDVVDDDIEFPAENGDFIVNGPMSKEKEKEIKLLVDYGIDELRKEGVDIRVGNPKIDNKNKVPLIVASSETYIPRVIAEKIGYPILEALNDIGKPKVDELKRKLDNEPTDESKYQANEGMLVRNPEQGFLFRRSPLNVTGPNIDKFEERFVPGMSDNPPAMNLNQQTFFDDYEFGDIKKAIKKTEIQGFEKDPYIFTGVKPKKGKSSSAFGPMQITKSLIEDFEKRSPDYGTLSKEEKDYLQALKIQGEDKINQDLYGTVFRGPEELRKKVDARKIYGKKARGLKAYGKGTINPELHKKYYDKIADVILLHKLSDHNNIEDFLASYGEGADYADKVLNDLRDIMQGVEPPTAVKSQ